MTTPKNSLSVDIRQSNVPYLSLVASYSSTFATRVSGTALTKYEDPTKYDDKLKDE